MNKAQTTFQVRPATALLLALTLAGGVMSGCRGERTENPPRQFIPDMDDSPKFKNQSQTAFFEDGRMMRPRVQGAVPFGDSTDGAAVTRASFLKDDPFVFQGLDPSKPKTAEGDPAYLPIMPGAVVDAWIAEHNVLSAQPRKADNPADREAAVRDMLARGQQRFNIFCSACHGYEGDGRGLVGVRWGYTVPSYHDAKYKDRAIKTGRDGYIFHVIQNGVPDTDPAKPPKMPSYADKVNVSDAWAIVAYIRAMQSARTEQADTKAEAPASVERGGAPLSAITNPMEGTK